MAVSRLPGGARVFVDPPALRAFVRELPEVRDAVQATADAMARDMAAHAPRLTGALANSIHTERPMRAGAPGQTVRVVAGVFYAKFVEFGTRNMRPRPFMRPVANSYRHSGSQGG
jgi:HK97 gp10 family phage protein